LKKPDTQLLQLKETNQHWGGVLNSLTLLFSSGTLICCALPALLVTLGMGSTLVGLVGYFPQLVWLSEYKLGVFSVSGFMLLISGFWLWWAKRLPCPADKQKALACQKTRRFSLLTYGLSVAIYLTGAYFAFLFNI